MLGNGTDGIGEPLSGYGAAMLRRSGAGGGGEGEVSGGALGQLLIHSQVRALPCNRTNPRPALQPTIIFHPAFPPNNPGHVTETTRPSRFLASFPKPDDSTKNRTKTPLLLPSPNPNPSNSINSKWLSVTEAVVAAVEAAPGAVDEVVLAVEVDSAAGAVVVLPVVVPVVEVSFPSIQSSLATPLHLFSFLSFTGRGAPRGRGAPGGRGGGRGGKAGLGRKGPGAVTLEPHKHEGVYIAKGKEHLLVTRNMTPGESVYGEKRISIATTNADGEEEKVEYRVWNPFRSKLAAGILGGLDNIHVSRTFFFSSFFSAFQAVLC